MTWPSVPAHASDEAALDVLASILAANSSAILDKALRMDEQLASEVRANNRGRELAGEFAITLRPNPGVTLDTLEKKTRDLLAKLGTDGVDAKQLERVKSRYEANTVRRQETVGARTATLADSNTFTKNPAYIDQDIRNHLAVTVEDVRRVLETYVLGKPAVVLSVVPEGQKALAASGSSVDGKDLAVAVEAAWKDPRGGKIAASPVRNVAGSVAGLDRTKKPDSGSAIAFHAPKVWHGQLENGIAVVGTRSTAIPMTTISLSVPAGKLYESAETLGLSSMTAELLQQGTRSLTATAFVEELDRLGATLNASADDEEITFTLSCLDKHIDEAVRLLGEVVLHPRFAEEDFQRIRKDRLVAIDTRADQIRIIAADAYRRLLWGDSVAGMPTSGTHATIDAMKLSDVQGFWSAHGVPSGARLTFVGGGGAEDVHRLFGPITADWKASATAKKLEAPTAKPIAGTKVYLVDKPGAAQSELRIGHVSIPSTDPDFYPLNVLNYPLGGVFSSRVNLNLREDKGYTYGARTGVDGGRIPGAFTASSAVKTDVTKESVVEFMKELVKVRDGLTEKELAFTKDSMTQTATRQYESMRDLSGMVDNISRYGWADDYAEQRLKQLATFTLDDMKAQAQKHIHPDAMVILVVGDKKKIAAGLAGAGFGEPIELDIDGKPITPGAGSN
jgi:zinc protease